MQQEIHLYIDNKEVYFSEPPEILFTFQRVDYTNPSLIKNSFTKTVTIEGTPDNNKVFGEIFKLDRTQNETLFNPSKRVPFELYSNGDKIETGYAKLDSITKDGYKVQYEITLYGGLGDFFYGLSYGFDYDTERKVEGNEEQAQDEELRLKDLTYLSEAEDDPTEFNFNITKEAIFNAWNRLKNATGAKSIWDCINFAPAYNGLPEDFSADKVLINSNGYNAGFRLSVPANSTVDGITYSQQQIISNNVLPSIITVDSNTYTQQSGYAMSELRESITEWEMRDLRSYLQRPVLRVKALFEAIQKYVMVNGEYTLNLDEDFFNEDNPYYDKAWITLPMLQNLNGEYAEQEINGVLSIGTLYETEEHIDSRRGYTDVLTDTYDIVGLPVANELKGASINMKLCVNSTQEYGTIEKLYTTYRSNGTGIYNLTYSSNISVRLVAYDGLGNEVASSNNHIFTSRLEDGSYFNVDRNSNSTVHNGCFIKNGNDYVWNTEGGVSEFVISLNDSDTFYNNLKLIITKTTIINDNFKAIYLNNFGHYVGQQLVFDFYRLLLDRDNLFFAQARGYYPNPALVTNRPTLTNSSVIYKPDNGTMKSYQLITKAKLLSQDGTPCKYMIDYCKLFNLYFDKDPIEKVVTIRTRRNFYDDTVIDLEKKINRSSQISITPIAFDNKWYDFNYTEGDKCESGSKYYSTWGTDYGKHKVNTGYNFDNSSNDLLEDNKFENGIEVLEKSKYFNLKKKNNGIVPPFMGEWSTFKLFKVTESSIDSCDEFYLGQPVPDNVYNLNGAGSRYDLYPKLQLHSNDNSPIDGSNILVFFNGIKQTSIGTNNDNTANYYITDDTGIMLSLNGNESCWLCTNSTTDANGNEIAKLFTNQYGIPSLPVFSRNLTLEDNITYTWDFGKTNELFVPYMKYATTNHPTLYNRFWSDYIADLYDKTTRIVTAYVKLDGKVEGDWLKHFYFFDNSIWCLTKIEDYNITSFGTTKCEFAKVGSIDNYRFWYDFNNSYENVSLWLDFNDGYNMNVNISEALSTDLNVKIVVVDHRDTAEEQTYYGTIEAGETVSENLAIVLQDFDPAYGCDMELKSITFMDGNGTYVVEGTKEGLTWVYLNRNKFGNVADELSALNNSYGINHITYWGSPK